MSKKISFTTLILLLVMLVAVCFTPVKPLRAENLAIDYETKDLSLSYNFTLYEKGYYISAYKGNETNIEIPDYYNGIPVIGIEDAPALEESGVFYDSNILQVKLGKNIKYIGRGAFRECTRLSRVIVNDCLEEINSYAFFNCSSLKQLDLPKLKSVGMRAFEGAGFYTKNKSKEGVTDYYYQNEHNKILLRVLSIDGDSYEVENGTHLIAQQVFYPRLRLNKIILPSSIEYLGGFLIGGRTASDNEGYLTNFTDCKIEIKGESLQEFSNRVEFGEASFALVGQTSSAEGETHIRYIGDVAVLADDVKEEQYKVRKIKDGTKKIAKSAFEDNSKLEKIIIPSSVSYIGKNAFKNCKNLAEVVIEGCAVIDDNAFSGCEKLASVTGNIKQINKGAFLDCASLKSIDLSSVEIVGEYAFARTGLEEVTLPDNALILKRAFADTQLSVGQDGLITVGNHVLGVGQNVTQINVSNKKIADYAFSDSSVEEAVLSNVKLGKGTFFNALRLEKVTYDGTDIPQECFYGAKNLYQLNLQTNIESIGDRAFYDTKELTNVDLSQTTTIGEYAFYSSKISCINLGAQTELGDYAFLNTMLTQISVSEQNPNYTAQDDILYSKDMTKLVLFPAKKQVEEVSLVATEIGKGAVAYSQYLKSIKGDFTTVEDMAFYNSSINSITAENVQKVGYKSFYNSKVQSLELPSLTSVGYKAFAYCTNLAHIELTNENFGRELAMLKGCASLTELKLSYNVSEENSVKNYNIGYLFGGDYFASSVSSIQRYSDVNSLNYYLPKIEKITITGGKIGYGAMMNLKYLTEVEIGEDVTDIAPLAFKGCSALESVDLHENILFISSQCFSECEKLNYIDLSHIIQINEFAFEKCANLKEITISDKLSFIGSGAFSQADNLTKIVITDQDFFNNFDNDLTDYGLMFENAQAVIVEGAPLSPEQIKDLKEIAIMQDNKISRMEITMIILAVGVIILVGVYFVVRFAFGNSNTKEDFTRSRRSRKKHHKHHSKHHHTHTKGEDTTKN